MPDEPNKILAKMLERLYASLTTGPVLNCRPHASRQRVDLAQLARLEADPREGDAKAAQRIIAGLLGDAKRAQIAVTARPSPAARGDDEAQDAPARPAPDPAQSLLEKLRRIAEDARTYEQDTGAQVLYVGFPLLALPPAQGRGDRFAPTKRVLAPIAFIPVELTIKTTRPRSVTLECAADGADRVIPNTALLAWIEQQTGTKLPELFADEEGEEPWREIQELVAHVARTLELGAPSLGPEASITATAEASEAKEPAILPSAVLGLFPVTNQSLLRDLEALVGGEPVQGPIEGFLRAAVGLGDAAGAPRGHGAGAPVARSPGQERLVTHADPCQARAVRLAQGSRGLVVHGPPGTGKSQTIVNIVGDHLARGERVLFVCEKRTALDVVHHRLSRLGLGHLCAIVHDAQRDQRELYKGIREQLDALPDNRANLACVNDLARVDAELAAIRGELAAHTNATSAAPSAGEASFHQIVGQWLGIERHPGLDVAPAIDGIAVQALLPLEREVREVLERSRVEGFPNNSWTSVVGASLADFLAHPMDHWRAELERVHHAAHAADRTLSSSLYEFAQGGDPREEGAARASWADRLAPLFEWLPPDVVARFARLAAADLARASQDLGALAPAAELLAGATPDPELAMVLRAQPPDVTQLAQWLGDLQTYLATAGATFGFFYFGRKRAASEVLRRFGLALGAEAAQRVSRFLNVARARRLLEQCPVLAGAPVATLADPQLAGLARAHAALFELVAALEATPLLRPMAGRIRQALATPAAHPTLFEGLRRARERGDAVALVEAHVASSPLFAPAFRQEIARTLRGGEPVLPLFTALAQRVGTVEGILRIQGKLSALPRGLADALVRLAERSASADDGWNVVRRGVLAGEIARRVRAAPVLHQIDPERLRAAHDRLRALEQAKRGLVRDAILHDWTARQRARLLASTGSRLNGAGAEVRRRLVSRGEKAMRVRQVIAAGANVEGGDPLFDLRPVWMASPDTVAQIFPRAPIFDVVIFDEASQCRFEEALPVLTRAKRVVIAGDPKQLPPTRFFESSVTESQGDEGDGTEQGLFEDQQAEVEDLLGAALNLEIEQCYLDVHYRSRNADLIEFSNQSFYDARLQPIPAHPRNRAKAPPIKLVRVNGTYDKRANPAEAKEVVRIVKGLLERPKPPSIGIACFNLVQRDAILDALDAEAAADPAFGQRLAAARTRQGAGSFEGLFVKNLENVQGDERDHMIIATTYGPDPKGRFYRRFGPLALGGGGRRLNVLVTRAREEVHLVTSIPAEAYRSLPPIDPGRSPNGAWLLFSYLRYAEALEAQYAEHAGARAPEAAPSEAVRVFESSHPSEVALALARLMVTEHGAKSDVFWGNDGFSVDVALRHPTRPGDVTVGVLCDRSRYDKADDAVEWDLFRTEILEQQGWELVRVWTPQLARDPAGTLDAIRRRVHAALEKPAAVTEAAEAVG